MTRRSSSDPPPAKLRCTTSWPGNPAVLRLLRQLRLLETLTRSLTRRSQPLPKVAQHQHRAQAHLRRSFNNRSPCRGYPQPPSQARRPYQPHNPSKMQGPLRLCLPPASQLMAAKISKQQRTQKPPHHLFLQLRGLAMQNVGWEPSLPCPASRCTRQHRNQLRQRCPHRCLRQLHLPTKQWSQPHFQHQPLLGQGSLMNPVLKALWEKQPQ